MEEFYSENGEAIETLAISSITLSVFIKMPA